MELWWRTMIGIGGLTGLKTDWFPNGLNNCSYPDYIDQTKAALTRQGMKDRVPYGDSESYRFMCRHVWWGVLVSMCQ